MEAGGFGLKQEGFGLQQVDYVVLEQHMQASRHPVMQLPGGALPATMAVCGLSVRVLRLSANSLLVF